MPIFTTACPLDCYDSCRVDVESGTLKASANHEYTNGFLCPHLNSFHKQEFIKKPLLHGEEISLEEALHVLKEKLRSDESKLYFKGSGNLALMQSVTSHIFAQLDATTTKGSLCDGAGNAGIIQGRSKNYALDIEEIKKSDVVVFWGRNPHNTNSHILPLLKDKKVIVIDPYKSKIASSADLFIQLRPHTDIYLALLICRFIIIESLQDSKFLEEHCSDYEEFYELTQTIRIKQTLDNMDVSLGQIGDFLELVSGKKCSILVGAGVQKYSDGADVMRGIDAIGALLGLFSKEGCGVGFLGDSMLGIKRAFLKPQKQTSIVLTEFDKYDLVFIQGANPADSMPNKQRVLDSLKASKFVVYFGLYENTTSKMAHLVIPAKHFLAKNDMKFSYGSNEAFDMPKIVELDYGISEYELSRFLADELNLELKSEDEYLRHYGLHVEQLESKKIVKSRSSTNYKDEIEFEFLEEFDPSGLDDEGLFLLTSKSLMSLNTQFKVDNYLYINSSHDILEGSLVKVSSNVGSCELEVRIDENLRDDCILIYSGNPKVNYLTPSKISYDGESAVFQELKVKLEKV